MHDGAPNAGHAAMGTYSNIRTVDFDESKYGDRLLIDVAWVRDMPGFTKTSEPYRLSFYDIMLVSSGVGHFWLDMNCYPVRPGTVFFTSPGQTRCWIADDLDGICLFFPASFYDGFFNDPEFLYRLRYFHNEGLPARLRLAHQDQQYLLDRLAEMHQEIARLREDSDHLLRAIAYEVLIRINRLYGAANGGKHEVSSHNPVSQFRQMLERDFRREHRVHQFADRLGVTAGHLNFLCRKHLGRSAGQIIRSRVHVEAQRLLVHTDLSAAAIAQTLGYEDPAYFSRVFKKLAGVAPTTYRTQGRRELSTITG